MPAIITNCSEFPISRNIQTKIGQAYVWAIVEGILASSEDGLDDGQGHPPLPSQGQPLPSVAFLSNHGTYWNNHGIYCPWTPGSRGVTGTLGPVPALGSSGRGEAPGKRTNQSHHHIEGCGRRARADAIVPLMQPGERCAQAVCREGRGLRTLSQPVNP